MLEAIIFDVDGTIVDSEQFGHLPACNDAFATLGFPIHWSWPEFISLMPIPGNANRMRHALHERYPEMPEEELRGVVARLALLKKQYYIERYMPNLPIRPGVEAIMRAALERDVRLAIVSMSYERQVTAMLEHHLPDVYPHFRPILGKESGFKTAPDSPLYRRCVVELGADPRRTLVIEDSPEGFRAARHAGLPCAVIYNDYTFGKDFAGARLVARSLGPFTLDQLITLCLPDAG